MRKTKQEDKQQDQKGNVWKKRQMIEIKKQ